MCQGGCVKESSSQGQFPSRGSGGLADRNPEGQPLADMWAHDPTLPLLTLLSPALAGLFLESNRVSPEIRGRNSGLLG
jgi:hypothetical protein